MVGGARSSCPRSRLPGCGEGAAARQGRACRASRARTARSRSAPRRRSPRSRTATSRSRPRPGTSATSRSARQATVGGNLCASASARGPRGDLQAPLLVLGASARSAGRGRREDRAARGLPRERSGPAAARRLVRRRRAADRLRRGSAARTPTTTRSSPSSAAQAATASCASPRPGAGQRARSSCSTAGRRRSPGSSCATTRSPRPGTAQAPAQARRARARQPRGGLNAARPSTASSTTSRARRSRPLLHVLREELGITSPKAGCQQGGCGACTVLVDGEPRRSCLLPLAAVDGAAITTVEGLGTPEQLGVVQAAFHDHYGSQCGFCTPGLPARDPRAAASARRAPAARRSRRRSRARLPLHRLREDPRGGRGRASAGRVMKAVGARLPRYDGVAHVTGRTSLRRRRPRPEHALGEGAALAASTTPASRASTLEGRGDAGRARGRHLRGRPAHSSTGTSRRSASPADEPLLAKDERPLQGPADRARRGRGRGDRAGGGRGDRARPRGARARSSTSARPSTRTRRRSTTGATGTRTSRPRWTAARSARATSTRPSTRPT